MPDERTTCPERDNRRRRRHNGGLRLFRLVLLALVQVLMLTRHRVVATGPPSTYSIGCFSTVSTYGGPKFDFNNPLPVSAYNCPPAGCEPDARTAAFLYQIDQINARQDLLPNTRIVPDCVDDQGDSSRAFFAAMELLSKNINVVIGAYFSRVAINAVLVLKGTNVPFLSWGASNPQLSDKKLYSNFGRVCQSDAGQAEAMAFVAAQQFRWQSVALIYTADGYGQGGAAAFVAAYLTYNCSIVADQSLVVGASVEEVTLPLKRIKSIGVQTVIYFGHPEEFVSIIKAAQSDPALSLFTNSTAWMLCDDTVLYSSSKEFKDAVASGMLNGVLGFNADDGRSSDKYKEWAAGYMARNTTGMHPLITVSPKSISEINVFDSFAADAANAVAQAMHNLFEVKNIYDPTPAQWLSEIHALDMEGITGKISFDSQFERIGIKYTLKNMQGGSWIDVGTYVDHTFTLLDTLKFADGTSNPPPSFPLPPPPVPPATSVIGPTTSRALLAICIVVLFFTFLYGVALFLGRELKVFQNASVTMMALILLGGVLVCVSVLVALQTQSRSTCTVSQWLFNFGFILSIGSIMLKTKRIDTIFSSRRLQVTSMTDQVLLGAMACMLIFDGVVLILRTTLAPYHLNENLVCTFEDGWHTSAATALSLILIITKALLLLYTAYLTYRVKDLPSRFNESSYLSVCVYNSGLMCIVWVVIRYAVSSDSHPDLTNVFEIALKLIGTALVLGLLFVPKCATALQPLIERAGLRRTRSSHSSQYASGVSMLSANEGQGNLKTGQTGERSKRTTADLQQLIDVTIAQQSQVLERLYTQLESIHESGRAKQSLIQSVIDLLNQLEDERNYFRTCVAKGMGEKEIAHTFESRLKDIIIPQGEGAGAGGVLSGLGGARQSTNAGVLNPMTAAGQRGSTMRHSSGPSAAGAAAHGSSSQRASLVRSPVRPQAGAVAGAADSSTVITPPAALLKHASGPATDASTHNLNESVQDRFDAKKNSGTPSSTPMQTPMPILSPVSNGVELSSVGIGLPSLTPLDMLPDHNSVAASLSPSLPSPSSNGEPSSHGNTGSRVRGRIRIHMGTEQSPVSLANGEHQLHPLQNNQQ